MLSTYSIPNDGCPTKAAGYRPPFCPQRITEESSGMKIITGDVWIKSDNVFSVKTKWILNSG